MCYERDIKVFSAEHYRKLNIVAYYDGRSLGYSNALVLHNNMQHDGGMIHAYNVLQLTKKKKVKHELGVIRMIILSTEGAEDKWQYALLEGAHRCE